MIRGRVNPLTEAVISLTVFDSAKRGVGIDAKIDTAFDGELTLPSTLIAQLGLSEVGRFRVQLADGTIIRQPYYSFEIIWDGERRVVEVIHVETNPLAGVSLLHGYRLTIDLIVGGNVIIEPIP